MRQNATTGAPVRSDPKVGNACDVPALAEGRDREELGRRDDALPAPTVDTHLEHRAQRETVWRPIASLPG